VTVDPRFGRLLTSNLVALAIRAHLQDWLVPFLAEVERQLEIPARTIAQPASWEIVSSLRKFDESRLPSVVIGVDEIEADPHRDGDGELTAIFPAGIAVAIGGRTPTETERNAMAYGAAVRGAMLYHFPALRPSLGCKGVRWVGETYTEIDGTDRRTKAAAMILFDIQVDSVGRDYVGAPLGTTPPVDPYQSPGAPATADTVTIDVEKTTP